MLGEIMALLCHLPMTNSWKVIREYVIKEFKYIKWQYLGVTEFTNLKNIWQTRKST